MEMVFANVWEPCVKKKLQICRRNEKQWTFLDRTVSYFYFFT